MLGYALVHSLAPADLMLEKIAYSAFHTGLEQWLLNLTDVRRLPAVGPMTDGGIARTGSVTKMQSYELRPLSDGAWRFTRPRTR